MRRVWVTLLGCLVLAALAWPLVALADHIVTSATVSARLAERRGTDYWTVAIRWTATCSGAAPGTAWYEGDLYMVDADTTERIYVGGVVDTSGNGSVSGEREWAVSSIERSRTLFPELTIHCYENFPLHGGREVMTTGTSVFIPPRLAGRGGGPGGASGDYGVGDPTRPAASGGCVDVLVGTEERDTLVGGGAGEVVFGLGGHDLLEGRDGHDCLLGGSGNDLLRGGPGSDRLTGGRGADVLAGGPGVNAYDAGPGNDRVQARNGKREVVRCGNGHDVAQVDGSDRLNGCERVRR